MDRIPRLVDEAIAHFQTRNFSAFSMSFVQGTVPKDPKAWELHFLSLLTALIDLSVTVDRDGLVRRVQSLYPDASKVDFDAVADELVADAQDRLLATLVAKGETAADAHRLSQSVNLTVYRPRRGA
jgi:hypothetical protein